MTNEQIERLAMDVACGQMNEDTEALFREYLKEHPEHKKTADEFSGLCESCERGMGREEVPVPALKLDAKAKPIARPLLMSVYGRAAILLLAVFLGIGIGRLGHRETTRSEFQIASGGSITPLVGRTDDGAEGFWQEKADALRKPKLWAVQHRTDKNETFWGRYRKELTHVKTDTQ